ncbi:hypothetical protein HK405_015516 [Cladochytrium tenue]|nr:hypothetical protein HK405_015516 [Cladochytrium tenue]
MEGAHFVRVGKIKQMALMTSILQKTCLPDVSASMERWSPELKNAFRAIMTGERFPVLPNAQIYWLSNLSGPELVRILKSKKLLQEFGFDSRRFHIDDQANCSFSVPTLREDGPSAALWAGYEVLCQVVRMQEEEELGSLLERGQDDTSFRARVSVLATIMQSKSKFATLWLLASPQLSGALLEEIIYTPTVDVS